MNRRNPGMFVREKKFHSLNRLSEEDQYEDVNKPWRLVPRLPPLLDSELKYESDGDDDNQGSASESENEILIRDSNIISQNNQQTNKRKHQTRYESITLPLQHQFHSPLFFERQQIERNRENDRNNPNALNQTQKMLELRQLLKKKEEEEYNQQIEREEQERLMLQVNLNVENAMKQVINEKEQEQEQEHGLIQDKNIQEQRNNEDGIISNLFELTQIDSKEQINKNIALKNCKDIESSTKPENKQKTIKQRQRSASETQELFNQLQEKGSQIMNSQIRTRYCTVMLMGNPSEFFDAKSAEKENAVGIQNVSIKNEQEEEQAENVSSSKEIQYNEERNLTLSQKRRRRMYQRSPLKSRDQIDQERLQAIEDRIRAYVMEQERKEIEQIKSQLEIIKATNSQN
ncbi:MAG: hypothetical protein EZS28_013735, partial [Streblomastix strix]